MRELLDFFVRNSKWFVFIIYVIMSCVLLFSNNPYQHHVYLTSANAVSSTVYGISNSVFSYFNLRAINDDLNERNAQLQTQVMALQNQLREYEDQQMADTTASASNSNYRFVVAHVINNSISRHFNYITIDKGAADGIRPEMGVIDQNGVVGSVNVVSEHSARVISVLNPNFHVSCKIKGSGHFGSLSWDGKDPEVAYLEDLPRHAVFQPGDTIVTTGFSSVFPPDFAVGYIMPAAKGQKLNPSLLRVKLATDFSTLSTVQVVVNDQLHEARELEASDVTSTPTK